MPTRLITAPASEPVTLREAKDHLRLETDLDNDQVTAMIVAARQYLEEVCWRRFVTQTWELVLEACPSNGIIELPGGSLASVTSVKYVDTGGTLQTMATSDYVVDTATVPGRVLAAYGVTWPTTRTQWDAVVVRYVVGSAVADVPAPIKQACLLHVSDLYEHRLPEDNEAMAALIHPYRILRWP